MLTPVKQQTDRCPFPRPFAREFVDCPAFQAVAFLAADSHNKPLGTWHTCRHLTAGNDVQQRGRFYPRCALGSREQRLQWLAQVTPARLEMMRALQQEFDEFSLPHREMLFEARERFQAGPPLATLPEELERLVNAFLEAIDGFLLMNAERLHDVGLPTESLRTLIREWMWAWVRAPRLAGPRLRSPSVETLSNAPRAFVGLPVHPTPLPSGRLSHRPLYADAILQIVPTVDPAGLALVGDIDASNLPALSRALDSVQGQAGDVHLDLSGLLFCDLAGLQAIVRSAQALGEGRKLILHGVPRQLERALEILNWAPLPNLSLGQPMREGQGLR